MLQVLFVVVRAAQQHVRVKPVAINAHKRGRRCKEAVALEIKYGVLAQETRALAPPAAPQRVVYNADAEKKSNDEKET